MRRCCGMLGFLLAVAPLAAQDDFQAKVAVLQAEQFWRKLQSLRDKGAATATEVLAAELQVHRSRAVAAQLSSNDKAELEHRQHAVRVGEGLLKAVEASHKAGQSAAEEVDLTRRNLAVFRIELGLLQDERKAVRDQWEQLVKIEEQRVARAKKLFDKGVLSKAEMEVREKDLANARAGLKRAKADDN